MLCGNKSGKRINIMNDDLDDDERPRQAEVW